MPGIPTKLVVADLVIDRLTAAGAPEADASLGLSTDLLGAKLVGRYRSGALLEALKHQAGTGDFTPPLIDPGVANPAHGNSNAINNAFEYGDDMDGAIVPLAAHIRKAYPRDQVPFKGDGGTLAQHLWPFWESMLGSETHSQNLAATQASSWLGRCRTARQPADT